MASVEIPEKVTTLVTERDLGAPVEHRSNGNPFKAALICGVAAVILFAVAGGLFAIAGSGQVWRPMMWVALVPLAFGLCAVGYIPVVLVRGFQATYLYENGVVHLHNGTARSATWDEVEQVEILVIREGNFLAGRVQAYQVCPRGQKPMRVNSIAAIDAEARDPFGELLVERATAAGRPVNKRMVGKK